MKVGGIKCTKCNATIFSRARHDFHWCPCKAVAIDGGFDYMKITGNSEDFEIVAIDVEATRQDLVCDWKEGNNKFGTIVAAQQS